MSSHQTLLFVSGPPGHDAPEADAPLHPLHPLHPAQRAERATLDELYAAQPDYDADGVPLDVRTDEHGQTWWHAEPPRGSATWERSWLRDPDHDPPHSRAHDRPLPIGSGLAYGPDHWRDVWLTRLGDGNRARTLFALCVRQFGRAPRAIHGGPHEHGLWLAVTEGWVEYTPGPIVRWQLRPCPYCQGPLHKCARSGCLHCARCRSRGTRWRLRALPGCSVPRQRGAAGGAP